MASLLFRCQERFNFQFVSFVFLNPRFDPIHKLPPAIGPEQGTDRADLFESQRHRFLVGLAARGDLLRRLNVREEQNSAFLQSECKNGDFKSPASSIWRAETSTDRRAIR